jgi:hypothetical protein
MTAASKKVAIIEVATWWRFQRAEPVLTEVRPMFSGKKRANAPEKRGEVRVQAPI